ncbi:MAG: cadherin-like beta sandwich domain-containing protein [Anaerolineaceae bacterium]|nr:cadherin-like beta sandwich domain-containing protein [Anaerolineaceae bacterium]
MAVKGRKPVQIVIVVTAEDESTKTYTVTVNRMIGLFLPIWI